MWLDKLNDNIYINNLSIPGTHNSLALRGGCWSITQDRTLSEQLEMGIRYFDIRLKLSGGKLKVFHFIINQFEDLKSVLNTFKNFLNENKGEFIMMSIKEEGVPRKKFKQYLESDLYEFLDILYGDYYKIPKLWEVRGKIILVDFNHLSHMGYRNNNFVTENKWNDITDIEKYKKSLFKNIFKSIYNNKPVFYRTVCSANEAEIWDFFCLITDTNPKSFSEKINPYFYDSLISLPAVFKKKLGIIEFDFPSKNLINLIIKCN